ncbi:Fc.00g079150.m01.CDS01 [Cosmosporella sp. VM-42]
MSWLCQDSELRDEDWRLLDFEQAPNEAFIISKRLKKDEEKDASARCNICHLENTPTSTRHKSLHNDEDLEQWLTEVNSLQIQQENVPRTTINLLLAGKTSSLDELPFTQQGFMKVKTGLRVHGSIIRAINRNTSCTFSRIGYSWPGEKSTTRSIVYNCRTAASWEGDMALSATFFPETLTTNVVWYGCDLSKHDIHGYILTDAEVIIGRLANFDGGVFHPMLLPTIFADFERDRQIDLVKKCLTELVQRISNLARQDTETIKKKEDEMPQLSQKERLNTPYVCLYYGRLEVKFRRFLNSLGSSIQSSVPETHSATDSPRLREAEEPAVLLWMQISFLKSGLQNWQTQLRKMIEHVDELDVTNFGIRTATEGVGLEATLRALQEVGNRIKERLQDLIHEYDEFIRQCTHIMDGMTLATQLELNNIGRKDARTNQEISQVNLEVAKMTRRDGSLMRSIAMLGMFFLPATFVSTFFSMSFFQWEKEGNNNSEILSPYFWVYVVVTVALTALTMVMFYVCALRKPANEDTNGYKIA